MGQFFHGETLPLVYFENMGLPEALTPELLLVPHRNPSKPTVVPIAEWPRTLRRRARPGQQT